MPLAMTDVSTGYFLLGNGGAGSRRLCGLGIGNLLVPWFSPQALLWSEPTSPTLVSDLNP